MNCFTHTDSCYTKYLQTLVKFGHSLATKRPSLLKERCTLVNKIYQVVKFGLQTCSVYPSKLWAYSKELGSSPLKVSWNSECSFPEAKRIKTLTSHVQVFETLPIFHKNVKSE